MRMLLEMAPIGAALRATGWASPNPLWEVYDSRDYDDLVLARADTPQEAIEAAYEQVKTRLEKS